MTWNLFFFAIVGVIVYLLISLSSPGITSSTSNPLLPPGWLGAAIIVFVIIRTLFFRPRRGARMDVYITNQKSPPELDANAEAVVPVEDKQYGTVLENRGMAPLGKRTHTVPTQSQLVVGKTLAPYSEKAMERDNKNEEKR